jgi:hypothetical protein
MLQTNKSVETIKNGFIRVFCAAILGTTMFAGEVATMQKDETGVFWTPVNGVEAVMLKVVGPNDFYVQKECDITNVSISEFGADGLYMYELTSMKSPDSSMRSMSREERERMPMTRMQSRGLGLKESGHFRVLDGKPMADTNTVEEK